jgi:CRISPR-associated protein Cmr4
MNNQNGLYQPRRFLLMTLDPVHVGTGGYRLGRVDLSIVREPGTRLPKIPGTSLSGAIRQYAAFKYESQQCAGAGQSQDGKKAHCRGQENFCPICYTFGYLKGQDGGQSGTVSIGDARILFFPVHSLAGPVWVTCPGVLRDLGDNQVDEPEKDTAYLAEGLKGNKHLNLGWLMLPAKDWLSPQLPDKVPGEVKERAILVSDKLFSQIVNSNLEVRTSVSIDPETGAASDKALFTYEAIPRATILWMDVVQDDYRQEKEKFQAISQTKNGNSLGETWEKPLDVVKSGLALAEYLGIGGMGTRGFGRIKLLNRETS